MKGCCPFHGEKTPSFYVYEDGYHCFGCGAHGDAISFVMQTQGASFIEAVRALADEAGLELPKVSASAEAAERQRLDLHGVLDAAQRHYAQALFTPGGATALAYLTGRGLTRETIARFGLGWAGEGRGALTAALAQDGITQAQIFEAGLLRADEDGAIRGELFFNRVMFPIRDRTGRMISFGGRTLGQGQPKYVNGPETPVFSKRRTLYALDQAREAARRGAPVVVVEGYMDVIALHQAGFGAAVAPLGTALTAEQLEELWRLSPAPTLCFDGDAAGGRAAARSAQLALGVLAPDRSISLAALPAGEDPDTLVRANGPAAFQAVLDAAQPLSKALFDLLSEAGDSKTPERRTLFRRRLEEAAAAIPDKALAAEYRRALLDRFFAGMRRDAPKPKPRAARPVPDAGAATLQRSHALAAILLTHPEILRDVEEAYGSLALPPPCQPLRDAILNTFAQTDALDSGGLLNHLHTLGLGDDVARALKNPPSCCKPETQPAAVAAWWWHFYGLMNPEGLESEKKAAELHARTNVTDAAGWARLDALCKASVRLRRGDPSGSDEDDDAFAFEDSFEAS